jgi:site-specific DNA-methyltransferase (adenine-specific)
MKVGPKPVTVHPLRQNFTPAWAAELFYEQFFGWLTRGHVLLEPTCGDGRFLAVVPPEVDAIGVEIDPMQAQRARDNTGRLVITGDIRTVEIPRRPTAIIGNPPFQVGLVDTLLCRAETWLDEGGHMGLLLSSHLLQHAVQVIKWRDRGWGITPHQVPKNLFGQIPNTLLWVMFQKGGRKLWGFALYDEMPAIKAMRKDIQETLSKSGRTWRQVVEDVLKTLGGEADLDAIYKAIEPKRPTDNQWWKAKVRQQLGQDFRRTGPARYALAEAA